MFKLITTVCALEKLKNLQCLRNWEVTFINFLQFVFPLPEKKKEQK